jgi:carboxyl-terminal processing protease
MNKPIINLAFSILFLSVGLTSCKKDKVIPQDGIMNQPISSGTRDELSKDSLFLYAQQVYLWNDALPTYDVFKPRSYTSASNIFDNLNSELFAITQFKINPLTGKPYEYREDTNGVQINRPKYSYIEDLVASGKISFAQDLKNSVGLDGKGDDFGFGGLAAVGPSKTNYKIYLRYVSPGSSLASFKIGRGSYVNKINGKSVGTDFDNEVEYINGSIFDDKAQTISIGGKRADGTSFDVTVSRTKYDSTPIYKDTILTVGSKKIGYIAYARFSSSANSQAVLNAAFSKFAAQNVENLVIDLRYNGGGFVSTAQQMINLIAPTNVDGKTMFSLTYNSTMQQGKATILKNQPNRDQTGKITGGNQFQDDYSLAGNTVKIQKSGTLNNVTKVVFITTGGTASASELVINSLKPYVDVKTVGATSYGKPVGFFPIRIDKYDVYMSSFYSTNSAGQGNYFAGFKPDSEKSDDVSRDFGDPNEISLASALSYLNTGVFTNSASNTITVNSVKTQTSQLMFKTIGQPNSFTGMIDDLHKK